jgi:hypothetical protein
VEAADEGAGAGAADADAEGTMAQEAKAKAALKAAPRKDQRSSLKNLLKKKKTRTRIAKMHRRRHHPRAVPLPL